jgi:hypothetical protein
MSETQPESPQLESVFPKCGHPRTEENFYFIRSGKFGKKYPCCKTCADSRAKAKRLQLQEEGVTQRPGTKQQRDRIVETALEFYLDVLKPVSKRHVYYKLRTHDGAQFKASLQLPPSSSDGKGFAALVCSALGEGCLDGRVKWESLVDPSRTVEKRTTYSSKEEYLEFWEEAWDSSNLTIQRPAHIECWIEKDALLSGLSNYCYDNQITLRSCAGQAPYDMLYRASKDFRAVEDKPIRIFYYGDLDEPGKSIERAIGIKFRTWELFGGMDIILTRLGLTDFDANRLQIQDDPEVDALDDSDLTDRLEAAVRKIMRSKGKRR